MSRSRDLAGTGLLARNSVLNVLGSAAPLVVAVVAIPLLVQGLGTDRFGVLTIAWTLVGYFSLFDFGLGRALTQLVAERIGAGRSEEVPKLAWTALSLMALLGAVGGLCLAVLTPWLAGRALKIPAVLEGEAMGAFLLLALCLPFVTSTAGLRGMLEATQRFGMVNAIRVPMGVLTYGAPLAVLPFSTRLVPVVGALVAARILAWAVHLACCFIAFPGLRSRLVVDSSLVSSLLRFGGWMTMANLSSTLMVYFDRFLIGASVSMTAVAYYVTPYEAVTKLWLIPGALLGVLFPAFAVSFANDRHYTKRLFDRASRFIFLALFPVVLITVTFAREGLSLWLGPEFAAASTRVLQWLAVGVLINSVGMVAAAGLQGVGRPDLTAKLNVVELPFYLGLLWWLLHARGIEGAAIAWVARLVVDTGVLFALADRVVPEGPSVTKRLALQLVPALALLAAAATLAPAELGTRIFLTVLSLILFAVIAWRAILTAEERTALRLRIAPGGPPVASSL